MHPCIILDRFRASGLGFSVETARVKGMSAAMVVAAAAT